MRYCVCQRQMRIEPLMENQDGYIWRYTKRSGYKKRSIKRQLLLRSITSSDCQDYLHHLLLVIRCVFKKTKIAICNNLIQLRDQQDSNIRLILFLIKLSTRVLWSTGTDSAETSSSITSNRKTVKQILGAKGRSQGSIRLSSQSESIIEGDSQRKCGFLVGQNVITYRPFLASRQNSPNSNGSY